MRKELIRSKFFQNFKKRVAGQLDLKKQKGNWINLSENINITDDNFNNYCIVNITNMIAEEMPIKRNETGN